MDHFIGMDLGTGSLKCVLFDVLGNEVAQATGEYPLYQPENGWSEQDPEDQENDLQSVHKHLRKGKAPA